MEGQNDAINICVVAFQESHQYGEGGGGGDIFLNMNHKLAGNLFVMDFHSEW